MYSETKISVKSVSRKIKNFTKKLGVHQNSAWNLYLIVIDEIMKGIRYEIPWYVIFVNYVVVVVVVLVDTNTRM